MTTRRLQHFFVFVLLVLLGASWQLSCRREQNEISSSLEYPSNVSLRGDSANNPTTQSSNTHHQLRVFVDAAHAHTWIETPPQEGLYDYHILHGLARGIKRIQSLGHEVRLHLIAPWREEDFADIDVIILNLVSIDQPPFLLSEIEAVKKHLSRGGGLIVITDHSNCYYHGHVLMPLLDAIGIQTPLVTACDRPPHTITAGNAWICIDQFEDHPLVSGLQHIGFQTGGVVDSRFAVAWTSDQGWADLGENPVYGAVSSMGLYGDMVQSTLEPTGRQGVVLAKNVDAGRVVILADQNAFGGVFLGYADNGRLWLQAIRWAAGLSTVEAQAEALRPDPERRLVWCYEALSALRFEFGDSSPSGFYNFYAWLNRFYDARATDRPLYESDLLIATENGFQRNPSCRESAKRMLELGRTVVLIERKSTQTIEGEHIIERDAEVADAEISSIDDFVSSIGTGQVATEHRWISKIFQHQSGGSLVLISISDFLSNEHFSRPEQKPDDSGREFEAQLKSLLQTWSPTYSVSQLGFQVPDE